MKLIVAGGRHYPLTERELAFLDGIAGKHPIDELFSGHYGLCDLAAEAWATARGLPVRTFPPLWDEHGLSAGPIRNSEMAQAAGPDAVCVLFPGGTGTKSMGSHAARCGLRVYLWRDP